jgi:hypothetical protein
MSHQVALHGDMTLADLEFFLDPLLEGKVVHRGARDTVLDLTAVRFVPPGPIVALTAIVEHLSLGGFRPRIVVPALPDCRRYLAANGFIAAASAFADLEGAGDVLGQSSSGSDTVLPLTRLASIDDIPPLLRDIESRLDEMLGSGSSGWERAKGPLRSTVRELCANVAEHAGGAPGWIAAQRYRNHQAGTPFVRIAIGDAGRGIRRSLATQHTELLKASDGEALERMLKERLTSSPQAFRGNGYFVLQKATKELSGSFQLRSGTAEVVRPRGGGNRRRDGLAGWPGTFLDVSLTCGQ